MTPEAQALVELAERCEAATGADRELDALVNAACCIKTIPCDAYPSIEAWASSALRHGWNVPRYTASLDAAMTLVPEGWWFDVRGIDGEWPIVDYGRHNSGENVGQLQARTPALALCAASLRALSLIEATHGEGGV